MKKKKVYEKPSVVSLNGFSASGTGVSPQGWCLSGTLVATNACAAGPTPVGSACSPTGAQPSVGYCKTGNIAAEGCVSGGNHY